MTAVVVALAVVPPAFDVVKPSAFATDAAEAAITRAVATREAAVEGETDLEAVMAVREKGSEDVGVVRRKKSEKGYYGNVL